MQIEKSPQYIKAEDIKGGDSVIFRILTEPLEVDGKFGKKIETMIFAIAGNAKVKAKWSIGNKNRDKLIDKHGAETSEWIGKEVPVHVENINGKDSIMVN